MSIDITQKVVYNVITVKGETETHSPSRRRAKRTHAHSPNKLKKQEDAEMSENIIITKIEELKEWEALIEEAKDQIEALRDELKAEMLMRGTEKMEAGQFIMRYQTITSNKFDNSAFKKALPDIYKAFICQSISKHFSIA